jgi:hypothetical protein
MRISDCGSRRKRARAMPAEDLWAQPMRAYIPLVVCPGRTPCALQVLLRSPCPSLPFAGSRIPIGFACSGSAALTGGPHRGLQPDDRSKADSSPEIPLDPPFSKGEDPSASLLLRCSALTLRSDRYHC